MGLRGSDLMPYGGERPDALRGSDLMHISTCIGASCASPPESLARAILGA